VGTLRGGAGTGTIKVGAVLPGVWLFGGIAHGSQEGQIIGNARGPAVFCRLLAAKLPTMRGRQGLALKKCKIFNHRGGHLLQAFAGSPLPKIGDGQSAVGGVKIRHRNLKIV